MEAIADYFWRLRSGEPGPEQIPGEAVPATLADGYRVQAILVERILSRMGNGHPIGYKIACTSAAARNLLRTDAPIFGRLLSPLCWSSGKVFSASQSPILGIEPEFAFEMAEDVPERATPWDRETVAPFVGRMMPAIELVGHCFHHWSAYSGPSLVADNALNRGWVRGAATDTWQETDLSAHPVTLAVNGEQRLAGSGANVLGHPLNAIAWLAGELPVHGLRLRKGDLVTTGVCTDIYETGAGETVLADFGALGTVTVTVTD